MLANPLFRRVFGVVALFTLLAAEVWRYSITWYGYGVVLIVLLTGGIAMLYRYRARWNLSRIPVSLLAFVVWVAASTIWSFYPAWTALAAFTTLATTTGGLALAVSYSREELLAHLGTALRIIIGGSLLFELFVAIVIRRPVLPLWYEYPEGKLPLVLYWSRNALFTGERIQGLLGNANLLGFAALLALIVFALQTAAGTVRRSSGLVWVALAVITLALTRSATITIATVVVAAVAGAAVAIGRAPLGTARNRLYAGLAGAVLVAAATAVTLQAQLLSVLGKSPDLTGRFDIWAAVTELAQQRPVLGWGWVSYWVPFVPPFDNLVFRNGVRLLQAHNAWLDLWFQVGVIGAILFALVLLGALLRAWLLAIDAPATPTASRAERASALLPLLSLTALLVQSLTESRLLVEYGMALTALWAIATFGITPVRARWRVAERSEQ